MRSKKYMMIRNAWDEMLANMLDLYRNAWFGYLQLYPKTLDSVGKARPEYAWWSP